MTIKPTPTVVGMYLHSNPQRKSGVNEEREFWTPYGKMPPPHVGERQWSRDGVTLITFLERPDFVCIECTDGVRLPRQLPKTFALGAGGLRFHYFKMTARLEQVLQGAAA